MTNKKGQHRRGAKYGSQDWYGNDFVVHSQRTYFGDPISYLAPNDLKDNPKVIFEYLNNQVTEFIKRLATIVQGIDPTLSNLQVFIRRAYGNPDDKSSVYAYEDDGNTRTEAFSYMIRWVLPLNDEKKLWDYEVYKGHLLDAIMFSLTFTERIHDSNISSRFFSLHFFGIASEEVHGKEIDSRIDYNNDNMVLNSIITYENLYRVAKKMIEYNQDRELLIKAQQAFES